uniref:F-box/LRR-repeat protein 15/At3g58940/PEG3-like LRR domain-containing protein n=1 Tax=Leersia perrieri TaxID=77586 RepID=A0A0D9XIJ7_9ORYZ
MQHLMADYILDPPVSTSSPLASAIASRRRAALSDLLRNVVSRLLASDVARTMLSTRWRRRSAPLSLIDAHLGDPVIVVAVSCMLAVHLGPFRCAHLTHAPMEGHLSKEDLVFINRPWPLDLPLPVALLCYGAFLTRLHIGVWRLLDTWPAQRATTFLRLRELVLSSAPRRLLPARREPHPGGALEAERGGGDLGLQRSWHFGKRRGGGCDFEGLLFRSP